MIRSMVGIPKWTPPLPPWTIWSLHHRDHPRVDPLQAEMLVALAAENAVKYG